MVLFLFHELLPQMGWCICLRLLSLLASFLGRGLAELRRVRFWSIVGDGGVGRCDDIWDDGTAHRGRTQYGCNNDDKYDGRGGRYGRYDGSHDASEDLNRP
jgi:hypothetical protein